MTTQKVIRFSNISHHLADLAPFMYYVSLESNESKFHIHKVKTFQLFSSLFYSENFNVDIVIMVIMCDIATGNQGGRGFVSFVKTMNHVKCHQQISSRSEPIY